MPELYVDKPHYLLETQQGWDFWVALPLSLILPLLSNLKCYLPHAPGTSYQKEIMTNKACATLIYIYIYSFTFSHRKKKTYYYSYRVERKRLRMWACILTWTWHQCEGLHPRSPCTGDKSSLDCDKICTGCCYDFLWRCPSSGILLRLTGVPTHLRGRKQKVYKCVCVKFKEHKIYEGFQYNNSYILAKKESSWCFNLKRQD